ncbi:MAG TPA: hypothetical protein VG847_13900, partial [Chitinophagaceae bacterium]|nr:hypothetical protein [Chitinophagaceae bacterium]
MKISDYAPRTGAMDFYLRGTRLKGVEVGVDAGAHAESLLRYSDIETLYLIDIWDKEYYRGYCAGRLARWQHKIVMMPGDSITLSAAFQSRFFDFIYLDQMHDYETV